MTGGGSRLLASRDSSHASAGGDHHPSESISSISLALGACYFERNQDKHSCLKIARRKTKLAPLLSVRKSVLANNLIIFRGISVHFSGEYGFAVPCIK